MAKTPKIKKAKKEPKCLACRDGKQIPDTIHFGELHSETSIDVRCGYCRGVPFVLDRLTGITLRSAVMAERANAKN